MKKFKYELGLEVKDKVTGFTGIVMGQARYLTGCDQLCVQPKCEKEMTYPAAEWFDDGRLIKVRKVISKHDVKGTSNGSDYSAPLK